MLMGKRISGVIRSVDHRKLLIQFDHKEPGDETEWPLPPTWDEDLELIGKRVVYNPHRFQVGLWLEEKALPVGEEPTAKWLKAHLKDMRSDPRCRLMPGYELMIEKRIQELEDRERDVEASGDAS